ncbi:SBBP repeat-containing protein [Emticicia sp. 17c]|uniref:SBBP repeat-containing protein n=1 Tax=Emticicia sp. 17c TaxID=3127704 RepID=UPI00301D1581
MKKLIPLLLLSFVFINTLAQNVSIVPGGITPLVPRLSYKAILDISSPKVGDLAVDTTYNCMRFYNGNKWVYFLTSEDTQLPDKIQQMGGPTDDLAYSVAVDASGNAYITGYFTGTAIFGNIQVVSYGGGDAFVAKCNAAGEVLWVRRIGGPSYFDVGMSVTVDNLGYAYVTGAFKGTATFEGYGNISSNTNSYDVFIIKYDPSGNVSWVSNAGGTLTDAANDIVLDNNGNGYITGYFNGSAYLGSSLTSAGGSDFFIAKFSTSSGTLSAAIGGGGTADDSGKSIIFDGTSVYICGTFQGTASIGTSNSTSNGGKDIFLAKYSTALGFTRKLVLGGTADDEAGDLTYINKVFNMGGSLADGGVIFSGWFASSSMSLGSMALTSSGARNMCLIKLTPLFDVAWANSITSGADNEGHGVVGDTEGNIYVTGYYKANSIIGPQVLASNGNSEKKIYYAKYNYEGNLLSAKAPTSNSAYSEGFGTFLDTKGVLHIVGYFAGSLTIGTHSLTSAGTTDVIHWSILEKRL